MEKKVLELAKEQLAVRYPEELQSIIEVISCHRPTRKSYV